MKTTIGAFLLKRLRQLGIRHVFGVPGDYNLQFLEQIKEADGLEFIGTCNELNAAYAADGYARLNGAAAILTTYGVGELSAICGVAGAAAEHVPMVCITGAPPLRAMEQGWLLHHTLAEGNYDDMLNCYRQFTVAQTRLTPLNAVTETDRVLIACQQEKRPVYIQLPSDVSYLTIDAPDEPLVIPSHSDPERLEAALAHLLELWSEARRPALLIDMDADRFGLAGPLRQLVAKAQIPYASMTTAKGVLDETDPLWLGHYIGRSSPPRAKEAVETSDFLIATAPRFTEANSGHFSQSLPPAHTVQLGGRRTAIGGEFYEGVVARDLVEAFTERLGRVEAEAAPPRPQDGWIVEPSAALTQARLWPRIARFIAPGDVVIAESGTSNIGLTPQVLPAGTTYITANIWGSIGYTLPAVLGTALADEKRRHLLFIGDGSFQLTVQELSTILRLRLKPIIFLLNNRGYTIERFILGMKDAYNDVANWRYTELPGVFAPEGDFFVAQAGTEQELETVLQQAAASGKLSFIELHLDPFDAPDNLKKFGPATAEFDYGPRGPQRA